MSRPSKRHPGFSYFSVLLILGLLGAAGTVGYLLINQVGWSAAGEGPLLHELKRGQFLHEITESGEIESASNVDVRCEVKSRGMGGTTILSIIPEGTYVREGDELARLDSSALENELNQQRITCSNSQAAVITAQNDLDAAEIAKKEYLEGAFVLDRNLIEIKKFMAREAQRQAEQTLAYSLGLAKKGYVTDLRVETDKIAVEKAKLDYQSAELEMEVLEKYTKERQLKQLDSNIRIAEARLRSAQASNQLDEEQRELIETQIAKCTLRAPQQGQVVYANVTNRHGGQEIVIEEGVVVREHQVIIRLPDPTQMQVVAKINESRISLIGEGMPATVRLDAIPDQEMEGVVERVSEYPEPTSFWSGNMKQYRTVIRILGEPKNLKPGLTAKVAIQVELLHDVLHVPVLAVFEHGGKNYCVLPDGVGYRAQEVKLGSTNDKFVVIRDGLKEGDKVVLGAFGYRDEVALPKLADKTPAAARTQPPGDSPPSPGSAEAHDARERPDGPPRLPDPFAEYDKNGDGKIQRSEAPEPMQGRFEAIDNDGDDAVSREEWAEAMNRRRQQRERDESDGGSGP
ncbi:MAG: HlyD family efflux transporter periplasmic adaptor subunit [Pirellulaceae bacterium]|nr:HlyD family efflux transporter periplasmic adaptor subunit [Pirellulaceae bacterium]